MSENLKTLRFLHNLLLLTATAILAFVLAPDDSNKCKTALDELAALSELNGEDYYSFISERLKSSEDTQSQLLLTSLKNAHIPLVGHPRLNLPWFGEAYPFNDPSNNPQTQLKDFDSFFSRAHEVSPIVLNLDKVNIASVIRAELAKQTWKSRSGVASIAFSPIQVMDPGQYPDSGRTTQEKTSILPIQVYAAIVTRHFPVGGNLVLGFPDGPHYLYVYVTLFRGQPETGTSAIDWLRRDPVGKRLIEAETGTVFPHLKQFWNYIADMRPEIAGSFLKQRLESLRGGTISFFGISVASSLVIWIGPTISLFVCLTLLVNLKQFHSRANPAESEAINYPWFPMFSGWLAGMLTYASLVYPLLCNLWLLLRYGRADDRNIYIGVLATAILILVLLAVVHILRDVRKQVHNAQIARG